MAVPGRTSAAPDGLVESARVSIPAFAMLQQRLRADPSASGQVPVSRLLLSDKASKFRGADSNVQIQCISEVLSSRAQSRFRGERRAIAYAIRGSRRVTRALRSWVPSAFAGSYLKLDLETNWNAFLREVAQMLEDRTVNVRAEDIVQGALIAMQRAAKLFEHALAQHHR
jgi:hypothetical protein